MKKKLVVALMMLVVVVGAGFVCCLEGKSAKWIPVKDIPVTFPKETSETWFSNYRLEKVDNPFARDVNFKELVLFLEEDSTWKHEYILGKYVCTHFATDLHNDAEAKGIRACIVLSEDRSHAFNAFYTIDRGLVFVDESGGRICSYQGNNLSYYDKFHYFW